MYPLHHARKVLNQDSSSSLDSETIKDALDTNDAVLIGIENMFPPNIIKHTKATRAQRIRAILTDQEAQLMRVYLMQIGWQPCHIIIPSLLIGKLTPCNLPIKIAKVSICSSNSCRACLYFFLS